MTKKRIINGSVMRKRFSYGIIVLVLTGMLSGCGITYPRLTTEEYDQTVEYAAGLLLKYDKNYKNNLIDPEALREMKPKETAQPAEEPVSSEAGEGEDHNPSEVTGQTAGNDDSVQPRPLTEIMAMDGITFQYAGYETAKDYPSEVTPGEVYSVMMASENYDLFILNFDVVNHSGSDYYLDMLQRDIRFRVGWNGNDMNNALTTMLLNELVTFRGNLADGESVRLVVVSEIPEGSADGIFSVELTVREGGLTSPVSL